MTDAPLNIRSFEALSLAAIVLALIVHFAIDEASLFEGVIGHAIPVALTLLVSRGRKTWAKWVLVAMFVLGIIFMAWNASALLAFDYPAITFASTVMQAVALGLLFTPSATVWLSKDAQPA